MLLLHLRGSRARSAQLVLAAPSTLAAFGRSARALRASARPAILEWSSSPSALRAATLTLTSSLLLASPLVRGGRGAFCEGALVVSPNPTLKAAVQDAIHDHLAPPATLVNEARKVLLSLARLFELLFIFAPPLVSLPLLFFPGFGRHLWRVGLAWSLNEAGPTFQKLGQWASTRPDLFGASTRADFEAFHSEIRSEPWAQTKQTLEHALAPQKIEDVFASIKPTPVGAGCVAQVFQGKLLGSSQTVAIKVRRANVQERIERDVNLLCGVARLLETTHSMFKWLALAEQADNFAVFMLSQLDMRVEAGHLSKFAAMFKGNSEVSFPSPLFAYKEVLVETFETGAILSKLLAVDKAASHDPLHDRLPDGLRQAIGRAGVHAFLQMCIVDNFTHSDMHPGNMIVVTTPPFDVHNPSRPVKFERLVLIDAGLVTILSPRDQKNFVDLFVAVAKGDGPMAARLMAERSRNPELVVDLDGFVAGMTKVVASVQLSSFRLDKVQIGSILERVMYLVHRHHILLDPAFTSMLTAIVVLEGVGRQLTPDLDIFKTSLPIIAKADRQYKMAVGQAVMETFKRRTSSS